MTPLPPEIPPSSGTTRAQLGALVSLPSLIAVLSNLTLCHNNGRTLKKTDDKSLIGGISAITLPGVAV